MLALVLVGALIAQTTLGAPNRCTEFCDEPVTNGAISSGRNGGYSSYSRYGSHSSWSSGTGSIGSRNGLGSTGGRLENLDENGIASTFGGLDRPGTWEDKKHYVTDDGRGEMNYRAGQTVTNNGFSKFASHSYRYGTHDNHQPKPDSLILSTAEFDRELQGIRQRISNFMSSFRLDSGSTINANFLRDFTNNAKLVNSQMNNVCNQVDIGSQMYQQMQSVIDQFNRDVAQRQREIESIIYQSTSSSSVNVNADWVSNPSTQPSPAPIQYPTRPTVSVDMTQQVEQQLNVIHNMVAQFASTFNQADTTSQTLNNLDAEISIINRKISEISSQALQYETVRGRFEQLKTYFESCVSSIRARIEEMERRQREQEERRIQREQELRLEAERRAEERRLEQIRIQEENERIQREQYLAQQQQQQQLLLQQQQQQQLQLQQQQQLQLQQQQQQQQHIQPTQYPHTSGGSVQVSGSIEQSYSGSYGAHISSSGDSSTGSNSGYQTSSPVYQRPQSVSAPEVDIIATANTLQQDLHRLQNEVNRFNSYSMRLTSSNSASVIAEAESTAASLKNRINNLCDTSNKYSNVEINNLAEQLKQRLQGFVQNFHNQAASYSSQFNSQYSQNGQFGSSGGYQSSARYGSVQAPKVTNVEYEHSQSTEVEITGRNPSEGRNSYTRLGRSVGENYGPYFDLNQESIDYGQHPQPILDRDYTYGRTDELDSYNPHGYDLRNSKIPDRFDDYSQRSSPVELPREYQPVRSGDRRQGVVRHQSHRSHQTHQTEDLTYQPGAADDYYLRQYSQSPSIGSQWEGESDSTQQHVSYGESEDLENMERPRSQKIDAAHNPRDRTLVSDARNREVNQYGEENRRQGINRLKPHSAGEYETPNASERSRIAGSYSKFESSQRTEEMTLEKSGFNDYSHRTENPTSTSQQGQQMAYDSSRLEQQTEEPQSVRPIQVHKKFEYAQKTENLTLEQSGFYDYKGSTEKPWVAQVTTVASSGKVGSALEVDDLNLGNTYFKDYSSQSRNKQLNDKPQRIGMPSAVNYGINQQNEKPDIQQSGFGSLYSQNEKLENFDQTDLNQQTTGQINFGAESQVGRQYSSYATPEPGKLNVDNEPNLKPNVQHPVGQYIENLSQQHQESFLTDESSNGQLNINNHGNQILSTTRYSHDLLPTTRPTVKPAPKPIPRYTRPWQVSQVNNLPKKLETEEKQVERDNTKIEESVNLQSLDKQSESLRGDLPGVSETSPVPVTTEKLDINQQENSEYDSRQQFEQVNINANSQPDDLQKSRNDWVHNNDRNSQSGQTTYFSQQSIQHNYKHTQQSIYYSQQNNGRDVNSSNYQPIYTQNSNNQQQESLPHKLESDKLAINKQEDVRQQVQIASFAEQTNQDTNQREEDEFAERVIPLEETKTIGDLSEAETTTASPSFWKRVGHKLSNSFDKAKEKARNIFG